MKNHFFSLVIVLGAAAGFFSAMAYPGVAPSYVTSVRTLYSPTPVGSVTPVAIVASLPANCSEIDVFDSSGQTLELMIGASGSETRQRIIPPGGSGRVPQWLPQGSRVSLRALSATASAGEDDFTCLAN